MSDSTRKLHFFSTRRRRGFCILWLVFAPLVSSIRLNSGQVRSNTRSFLTIPRGGDSNGRNLDEDSYDDEEERTRFWSLTSLFRLNANAKDDASTAPPFSHLQRGNKRGGALAVRTSKSRTFVDVTPVSTASARPIIEDQVSDGLSEEDESTQQLEHVFDNDDSEEDEDFVEGNSEIEEVDEIEVLDAIEEEASGDEESDEDVQPTSTASNAEPRRTEAKSNDENIEVKGDEIKVNGQVGGVQQMSIEEVQVDVGAAKEAWETQDGERAIQTPIASDQETIEPKGMLQDASKLWWTNVWTEQTSDEIPELAELVSDESVAKDEDIREPPIASGEVEIADKVDTGVKEAELEEMEEEEPTVIDEHSSQTLEVVDVEVTPEALEVPSRESFQPDLSQQIVPDVDIEPGRPPKEISPFASSGYWGVIDRVVSLGLSDVNDSWKLSRRLRPIRKATAHVTGLHGVISQKKKQMGPANAIVPKETDLDDADLGMIQRRIAAIEIAKQNVAKRAAEKAETTANNRRLGLFRRRRRRKIQEDAVDVTTTIESTGPDETQISSMYLNLERKSLEEQLDDQKRKERVQEIDRLIQKGQKSLLDLQCEKDHLQRRPNPLYNYTTDSDGKTTRVFNFPPPELVDEYIDEMFANGRLERMNHTELWQNGGGLDDDEDESIGDDLFVPSADARKLYERETRRNDRYSPRGTESKSSNNGNGGGGSWLLRQNLGKGGSLGEKIGVATETAAYKAVGAAVMSSLARSIAALHGVNIMTHSDIRLYMEQSPDLPPVGKNVIPGSGEAQNYAQEAIMDAMRKGVTKRKRRSSRSRRVRTEEAFLQRDAVVETLLSHCQISAPLLKLFPLAWQRALLGNIITLIAAVVSDFCDGIQLQILGHQLSFAFKPITEVDMIRHIGMDGNGFNHRRARAEQFEAAIRATADDVSQNLQFLDRWHHRALGSGMLRAQIANLIARIVLTLADEVLSGARMDLWSAQAGGPRMIAGVEYRVSPDGIDEVF